MKQFRMMALTKFLVLLMLETPVAAFGSTATTPVLRHDPALRGMGGRASNLHVFPSPARPSWNGGKSSTELNMNLGSLVTKLPRGGSSTLVEAVSKWNTSPTSTFNTALISLAVITAGFKVFQRTSASSSTTKDPPKPQRVKDLQFKFLAVFWLLRCADWLQGPYFYEVYASKSFNGVPASLALVSQLFLTGFASTAFFGPLVGRAADTYGRKKGTLAFSLLYAVGAASTKSPLLQVLFLGRVFSGIGTSLLFSAPEAWLVGESQKEDPEGTYLGETFGMAYAGDSIVAILAGQIAGAAAGRRGPTGPFELSTFFLAIGGLLAAFLWKENVATGAGDSSKGRPSIKEAVEVIKKDPKITMVGGVQSLFEAAMYIFVLQWPPAISKAIAKTFGGSVATPYGNVFSCFMACCLLGSTLFGQLSKMAVPTENFTAAMLSVATLAMSGAALTVGSTMSLPALVASFFAFEACVGLYFPSIGTLRSKYVPDSHRSVIMNLFGIPLNVLVVGVFLSISKLGLQGALGISSGALALATVCMFNLNRMLREEAAAK